MLPGSYAWHQTKSAADRSHTFTLISFIVGNVFGHCFFHSLWLPRFSLGFLCSPALPYFDFGLVFAMDSPSPSVTSASLASPLSDSPASVDVSAHRSCCHCRRRMSSLQYDSHTVCVHCRAVLCSLVNQSSEFSDWPTDVMQD